MANIERRSKWTKYRDKQYKNNKYNSKYNLYRFKNLFCCYCYWFFITAMSHISCNGCLSLTSRKIRQSFWLLITSFSSREFSIFSVLPWIYTCNNVIIVLWLFISSLWCRNIDDCFKRHHRYIRKKNRRTCIKFDNSNDVLYSNLSTVPTHWLWTCDTFLLRIEYRETFLMRLSTVRLFSWDWVPWDFSHET